MALFKRGNVWWMRFTAADGQRVRRSTGTENKRDAQVFEDKLKVELYREHRLGIKPDRLFRDAADLFVKEKSGRRSVECYDQQLGWWAVQFSGLSIKHITQERIIETIEKKLAEGVSYATCNRYLAALRAALRLVQVKYRWIDAAPKVFMFSEPKGRVRWLKPDEIARLLASLPEHLRGMARLSFATGLRKSNVQRLMWSQVDLVRRTLTIDGSLMKNGRDHSIPLSDEAVAVIRENVGKHQTYVFTYQGKPITAISHDTWKRSIKAAGLTDFRWHDMRHTWATTLAQAGVPTDAIQALGAWESPAMVQRYAHHSAESLRRHVAHLDDLAQNWHSGGASGLRSVA